MTELIMAESDRLVWREAFDLYDWNHGLNNTEAAWIHFYQSVSDFANRNDWRNRPLVKHLAFALIDAVGEEVKIRLEKERPGPAQLSFLEEGRFP